MRLWYKLLDQKVLKCWKGILLPHLLEADEMQFFLAKVSYPSIWTNKKGSISKVDDSPRPMPKMSYVLPYSNSKRSSDVVVPGACSAVIILQGRN